MAADVELSHQAEYLRVAVHGTLGLTSARALVEQVAEALEAVASPLLLDVRDITCKLSYVDISVLFADMSKHPTVFGQRIAILYQKNDKEDIANFLKLYAGNRGLLVQTFLEENAALQWLVNVRLK